MEITESNEPEFINSCVLGICKECENQVIAFEAEERKKIEAA